MLDAVLRWDLNKQRLAAREFYYYLERVQRHSSLTQRFEAFYRGSGHRPVTEIVMKPSSPEASARFRRVARRDTPPEMRLRSELHGRGLRYRVDAQPVPGSRGRADLVFSAASVAVFVDGCFWHGCPLHMTWPQANAEWWRTKIERNCARDRDTDRRLTDAGWTVVRVWEHEDPCAAADRVVDALSDGARGARARSRRS